MVSKAALSKPAVLGDFVQRGPRLKRRQRRPKSPLTIEQILAWADAHHERTGKWPTLRSGAITDAPGENWVAVNYALKKGRRGLLKNSSLAWLLIRQRGVKKTCAAPRLTIKQILAWADAHHQRTGQWPNQQSGPIAGSQGDTWCAVNRALAGGWRGLRGGSSLTRLLARKHSLRNSRDLPSLSVAQILAWADAHYKRTGKWPTLGSGLIAGSRGDTWSAVSDALRNGSRGLPKGSSLARLLARRRGARKARSLPVLSVANILAWADAHHRRHGQVAAEAQWTHRCHPGGDLVRDRRCLAEWLSRAFGTFVAGWAAGTEPRRADHAQQVAPDHRTDSRLGECLSCQERALAELVERTCGRHNLERDQRGLDERRSGIARRLVARQTAARAEAALKSPQKQSVAQTNIYVKYSNTVREHNVSDHLDADPEEMKRGV